MGSRNEQHIETIILHSRKLTWKLKKGPIKTTVPSKGGYMGCHVSLGECIGVIGVIHRPGAVGAKQTKL